MSKRILFGGLAAVAVALTLGGSVQAQHHHGGGHYGGGGGGRYYGGGNFYRPVYSAPIVVAPRPVVYSGINSPYFGFGSTSYYSTPIYGTPIYSTPIYGTPVYGGGYYGGGGVLNIGYSRPGFGINFGTIIR